MRTFIMALIFAASLFVPQWARAEMPRIDKGISIINGLIEEKARVCNIPEKVDCDRAYQDIIDNMREAVNAQKKLAKARTEGNTAEEIRLLKQIVKISNKGSEKVAYVKTHFLKLPAAAGK